MFIKLKLNTIDMRNFLILTVFILTSILSQLSAQLLRDTIYYRKEPQFILLDSNELRGSNAVIIEENRTINNFANTLTNTVHRIIHINTKEGLDDVNKIYVPNYILSSGLPGNSKLKGRSISSSGKITEFNTKNVKVVENIDKNLKIKIYAIEGAEVGGQIEYSYTYMTDLSKGEKFVLSNKHKILKSKIRCIYTTKYGFNTVINNINYSEKKLNILNTKVYEFENIPIIKKELYSTFTANAVTFEYFFPMFSRLKNYDNIYPNIGESFFVFYKPELKSRTELFNQLNTQLKGKEFLSHDERSIKIIDSIFKKNYLLKDHFIQSKLSSFPIYQSNVIELDRKIIRTYCSIFNLIGIEYQVILCSNKNEVKVNTSSYSPFTLNEFLIYFPKFESYLYPLSKTIQYNLIPNWLVGSKGFLIEENMEKYSFIDIPATPAKNNLSELKITVNMNLNDNSSLYSITGAGTGQVASNYNSLIFNASSDEEIKKRKIDLVNWRYPNDSIIDVILDDPYSWGYAENCKDLACEKKYYATVKSTSFFEESDDRLFLNVGHLIGPQDNLYSVTERVHPISRQNNQTYLFEIKIPIPIGYVYSGEQNTAINNQFLDDNENEIASFTSTIEVIGTDVVIKIIEAYHQVEIDKKYYNQYRTVINSAADFNKAIVILSKKRS